MNKEQSRFCLMLLLFGICYSGFVRAQDSYSNFNELTNRLQTLESQYGDFTELQSLDKTLDGRELWMLTIGSGDVKNHPAVAVIGGVKGSHIVGSELAVKFAEQLLGGSDTEEIQALLETTTFYVLPRINPDATEQYFASLKYARDVNANPTNEDRDDATDEDPFEDLNGDNVITVFRVQDETGKWMPDPDESRLLKKADINKGEKGTYKVYTEGRDNDNDGEFNEDGKGGVNINKNFTFDFPYFEPGAGDNMASQIETRALLDFLYEEASNVFAVVSFGPENNLTSPLHFNRGAVSKRVISGWYEEDISVNKLVSDTYKDITGLENAPNGPPQQGDLFQWAYFHYGRYSFSTPGWWVPDVMDEEDKPRKFDNEEAKLLAWSEQNSINTFVEWEEIDHPDFPDKTVEVGGFNPFAMSNPPYNLVDSLAQSHTDFIVELASMRPDVKLLNLKTENTGGNLTRITVDVYNGGILPTASRLGERTDWVKKVNIKINLSDGLSLLSGDKLQIIDSIEGDGTLKQSWLVRGNGSFSITAGSPNAGISTIEKTIR